MKHWCGLGFCSLGSVDPPPPLPCLDRQRSIWGGAEPTNALPTSSPAAAMLKVRLKVLPLTDSHPFIQEALESSP